VTSKYWYKVVFFVAISIFWLLGFIKVPYFESNVNIIIGFISSLVIIFIFRAILYRVQGDDIIYFLKENTISRVLALKHAIWKNNFIYLLFLSVIIFGWICSNIGYFYLTTEFSKIEEKLYDIRLSKNLSIQIEKSIFLIELVNKLDSNTTFKVNKSEISEMLNRIVLLSSGFRIYSNYILEKDDYSIGDTIRRELLIALLKAKIDSFSFNMIKGNLSFYGVDLSNLNLHSLNLDGIDLRYANLSGTDMDNINLDHANLNGANISCAHLEKVSLVETNLISANCNWSSIIKGKLMGAKFDSANLSHTIIKNSNLVNSSLIQSSLNNSIIFNSDLSNCLLMSANLKNAVFTNSNLYNIDIYYSSLGSTLFENVIVNKGIREQLIEKNNVGLDTLFNKYVVYCELGSFKDSILCRFKINVR